VRLFACFLSNAHWWNKTIYASTQRQMKRQVFCLKQNEIIFDYAEKDQRVDLNRKLRFS